MSVGSDNNKLSIPPAVVPGISVDPPTPKLTAKSSSPRKRVTRANVKTALTPSQIALSKFIEVSDRLSEFESRTNTPSPVPPTLSMLNIRREEIRALWDRIKAEKDEVTGCIAEAGDTAADSLPILKAKYGYCYSVYERCGAQIADMIAQAPQVQAVPNQVFSGGYLRCPTFRDLFTAIYINNPGLTPVEKLFHLNAKTNGDAHTIVSNSPLTNDGFRTAWANLSVSKYFSMCSPLIRNLGQLSENFNATSSVASQLKKCPKF